MKLYVLIVIFLWGSGLCLSAQQRDSTYIQPYPQKVWVKLYIPTKFLSLSQGNNTYIPNYPFNLGVGIGLRKVLGFNLLYAHSLFYYQNKANMSTLEALIFKPINMENAYLLMLIIKTIQGFISIEVKGITPSSLPFLPSK